MSWPLQGVVGQLVAVLPANLAYDLARCDEPTARYPCTVSVRATVQNGRLVLDEATQLPDGTVLDLVLDDEGDDLDGAQRQALDAAIATSLQQARDGKLAPGDDILARLRARRG